jgi:xanthine dehydrogenase accessory factor
VSLQSEFADIAATDGRAALVTVIAGESLGAKLLVRADGSTDGGLGTPELDRLGVEAAEELLWAERSETREAGDTKLFVDVVAPAPRLVVFGAVDYAAALCRLAKAAGWRPFVCDPRSQFATAERFPDAEAVIAAWPADAFARLGGIDRATYVAVLTHDPKLDDAALSIALRSEAPYVGAMGSRRAQAQRRERLVAAGVDEELIDRIAAPIGLDLGAVSPEETALSIMSEVVAVRNGRDGGRLSQAAGRIHEVGA